ncbi:hypothetical protein [Methylobacterium komagatae]
MRQTTDTQTKITLSPRALAQVEKGFIERTIAEAWAEVEGHLPCYEARAEYAVGSLEEAGFEIVRKPKPGSTAEDRVEFARRTGNWSGVSDRDYMDWVRSLVPAGFVFRTVTELTTENERAFLAAVEALDRAKGVPTGRTIEVTYGKPDGSTETVKHTEYLRRGAPSFDPPPVVGGTVTGATVLRATETVALQPGNVFEIAPGMEIRSADAEVPCAEHDDWGLRENAANHLAGRHGCQVAISELDDARYPLSEGIVGDPQYVIVTERDGGRVVGLVEAWHSDDGDPLVPKSWLEIVLGARDVEHDPQRAA